MFESRWKDLCAILYVCVQFLWTATGTEARLIYLTNGTSCPLNLNPHLLDVMPVSRKFPSNSCVSLYPYVLSKNGSPQRGPQHHRWPDRWDPTIHVTWESPWWTRKRNAEQRLFFFCGCFSWKLWVFQFRKTPVAWVLREFSPKKEAEVKDCFYPRHLIYAWFGDSSDIGSSLSSSCWSGPTAIPPCEIVAWNPRLI